MGRTFLILPRRERNRLIMASPLWLTFTPQRRREIATAIYAFGTGGGIDTRNARPDDE